MNVCMHDWQETSNGDLPQDSLQLKKGLNFGNLGNLLFHIFHISP